MTGWVADLGPLERRGLGVLVAGVGLVWLIRGAPFYRHPKRLFDDRQKRILYRRWGKKCALRRTCWWWQCRCKGPVQGRHRRAHYIGGWTIVSNGMPVCKNHNEQMGTLGPIAFLHKRGVPIWGPCVYLLRLFLTMIR